ncbi:MBL fold metallo-hydrolase [Plastorhodobacter daqingensis]|uniref:MBL fold metallo-hydrolase n=1 Tax=Plastorhodobacter daqingensis TaxID=1387281 RepID=A0ABW2UKF1_9RHOB
MALTLSRRIGAAEVTVLTDGALSFPPALFPRTGQATIDTLLDLAGEKDIRTNFNAVLIRGGGQTVLVDAGFRDLVGAACGHLPQALAAAGAQVGDIDRLFTTHLHADHVAGMITTEGRAVFPRAELVLTAPEHAFWTETSFFSTADQQLQDWQRLAQAVLDAYADRLVIIQPGDQIAPGLWSLPLPGHTPGHSGWRLSSGDRMLVHMGDIVHAQKLQLADPEIGIAFDLDMDMARQTRKRLLDELATDGTLVTGGHILHPALGRVVRHGSGYRFEDA